MRQQGSQIPKRDFGSAPNNYVAGHGRGAVGFITRSDIGPAKLNEPPVVQQGSGRGRGSSHQDDDDVGDREDYNDAKYDEWNGYQIPLFNHGEYDEEDREADQVYSMVEDHMDGRRRSRKEKLQREEYRKIRSEKPNIAQQFSDLKRDLTQVSVQEWMNIPDPGDYSIKKKKIEKYVPVPDSIIQNARKDMENVKQVTDGLQSEFYQQNLNEIGEARGTLLTLKLDRMEDSVVGQSNVNKKGYLTELSSVPMASGTEIGDFKKARLLLKSLIQADPKNSFGWISAARVEELDGKIQAARNILAQGLQQAEDSVDIWIECARLETQEKAKQILAKAVSIHPTSQKIWLAAANKETDKLMKAKILKRALEYIPNSEKLWKQLIELSNESEARVLLQKAVECIPTNLEFWLALAKLEQYDNAKVVINKARQHLPQEPSIWIHAAKLEESEGKDKNIISLVLKKGIKVLEKNGVKIVRDEWLAEAELAEKSENFQTCYAIVKACSSYEISKEEVENVLLEDVSQFEKRNSIFTARAILQYAVELLETKEPMLRRLISFEEKYSSKQQQKENITQNETVSFKNQCFLDEALNIAIKLCPQQVEFWIKMITRCEDVGNLELAKQYIQDSLLVLPNNEQLLIHAGKLESRIGNHESALQMFINAKNLCNGLKSWVTLIKFQFLTGNVESADRLCDEGSKKFQDSEKLWILWGKIKQKCEKTEEARKVYENAIQLNPLAVNIWMSYIQMEINLGLFSRARPILERVRTKIPKNPDLWVLSVKLEMEAGNRKGAIFTLNKALQECQRNGELWSLAIELEPKNTRKKKSADAVQLCVEDPYVYLSTAKIFWKENKMEKFRRWVEKSLLINPRFGDAWAFLSLEQGSGEELIKKCIECKPKFGRLWNEVKKSELGWKMNTRQILDKVIKKAQNELQRID